MDIKTVKKMLKAVIEKSRILKSLIISLLAFPISYLVYYGLHEKNWLTYIGVDSSNLSYLQEYYKNRNTSADTTYVYEGDKADSILIVCIKDTTNRMDIAKLINTVCTYQPIVVGVDLIFPPKSNDNDNSAETLNEAVKNNSDKLVLAQVYNNQGDIIKSIINEDPQLCFGLVNSYSDDKFAKKKELKDKQYDYFAYLIADKYYKSIGKNIDNEIDWNNNSINFSNSYFRPIGIDQIFDDRVNKESLITNKIVLIGRYNEISDIHPTPFVIKNKDMISGIELHAYAINSLISPNRALRQLSIVSCLNIFIFYLLCLVYTYFYVLLTDENCKYIKNHRTVFNLIRPVFLLVLTSLLLLLCYIWTISKNIIPNVVPLLITVFIISTFNDFFAQNINSKKYE